MPWWKAYCAAAATGLASSPHPTSGLCGNAYRSTGTPALLLHPRCLALSLRSGLCLFKAHLLVWQDLCTPPVCLTLQLVCGAKDWLDLLCAGSRWRRTSTCARSGTASGAWRTRPMRWWAKPRTSASSPSSVCHSPQAGTDFVPAQSEALHIAVLHRQKAALVWRVDVLSVWVLRRTGCCALATLLRVRAC